MNTLDNLHRTNEGSSSLLRLGIQPVEYSSQGTTWIRKDIGGKPGSWDTINRTPRPLSVRPVDPFNRAHLGRDIPGQEILGNPGFIPIGPQPMLMPGGNAEGWVMYQHTRPAFLW